MYLLEIDILASPLSFVLQNWIEQVLVFEIPKGSNVFYVQ